MSGYCVDSLVRWNKAICPLMAGIPAEQAEFMLQRISQAVRDAGAELGDENCKPNFHVVLTPEPDQLLDLTLCHFHHRKVHEGHVIVRVLDDGAIRFVQPDGESFDSESRTCGDWRELRASHARAGIHIDAKTAATRWDGGPMDYGLAMDVLWTLRRDVSAET